MTKLEWWVIKSLAALGLAIAALALMLANWVYFPLTPELKGVAFSIFGYTPNHPHVIVASYGVIAALLLLFAIIGCLFEWSSIIASMGAALIALAWCAYLRVAVGDPSLTMTLAHQAEWSQLAHFFSVQYLPGNFGSEPSTWQQLSFDTVYDRLISGWYFLGLGTYLALAVGSLTLAAGLHGCGRRTRRSVNSITAGILALTSIGFLRGPIMAQKAFGAAVAAEAQAESSTAVGLYRQALREDGWYRENIRVYARIGAIDSTLGQRATIESRIHAAEQMVDTAQDPNAVGQLSEAIAIYDHIAAEGGDLAPLAQRRAASIAALYGRHLFADGATGAAVTFWEAALRRNPNLWIASFYLTRGYYALNRFQESAQLGQHLVDTVSDPSMLGDLYSNLGDALTGLEKLDLAHQAYFNSYNLDYVSNRRGLDALVGP